MDNKWSLTIVGILAAALLVISIMMGVNMSVKGAVGPVGGYLEEISAAQKDIQKKISEGSSAEMKAVLKRLDVLERDLKVLQARVKVGADDQDEPAGPAPIFDIPVDGTPILGKADAPITITVFNDFQCPYCSRFHSAVMAVVKEMPDNVRFMLKHYPLGFHANARSAAKAAMVAGEQGKFYEMSELLFQNMSALSEDTYKELAGQLGLNVDQFMKDLKERDSQWEKKIQEDMALAEKVGVRGTPSYYLNGQATMARSPEQWKAAIQAALSAKTE